MHVQAVNMGVMEAVKIQVGKIKDMVACFATMSLETIRSYDN